ILPGESRAQSPDTPAVRPEDASMEDAETDQRLSRITTRWGDLLRAHSGATGSAGAARNALILRYGGGAPPPPLCGAPPPQGGGGPGAGVRRRFPRGGLRRGRSGAGAVPRLPPVRPRHPRQRSPPGATRRPAPTPPGRPRPAGPRAPDRGGVRRRLADRTPRT